MLENYEYYNEENSCSDETDETEPEINVTLLNKINDMLISVIKENKNLINYKQILKTQEKSIFNSSKIPSISFKNYLYRIQNFTEAEDNTLIIALIYLDRFTEKNNIILTDYNVHKIFFLSVLIAIKYNEDLYYELFFYAKICGMDKNELKLLERKFVDMINFELFVKKEEFENYQLYINQHSKEK